MMDSTRGAQKFMAGGSVGISGGLQGALRGNLGEGLGDVVFLGKCFRFCILQSRTVNLLRSDSDRRKSKSDFDEMTKCES